MKGFQPQTNLNFFQLSPEIIISDSCYDCSCDAKFTSSHAHA